MTRSSHLAHALVLSWIMLAPHGQAHAAIVRLTTGDMVRGTIEKHNDDHVIVNHRVLGRLTIPRSGVIAIVAEDGDQAQPTANQQASQEVDEVATQVAAGAPPVAAQQAVEAAAPKDKPWKTQFDLGLTNVTGNTNEQSLAMSLSTQYQSYKSRFEARGKFYYKRSDGETTDNKLTSMARNDWLLPHSPWFLFAQGTYDFDDFESWQQRAAAHAGPGYQFIDNDEWQLRARGGLGARREFGSENNNLRFEGLGGLDLTWNMTQRATITFHTTVFPVLSDISDVRTKTGFDWRWKLLEEWGVNLVLSLDHEYQSIVDPGNKRNDFRAFAGLGLEF